MNNLEKFQQVKTLAECLLTTNSYYHYVFGGVHYNLGNNKEVLLNGNYSTIFINGKAKHTNKKGALKFLIEN